MASHTRTALRRKKAFVNGATERSTPGGREQKKKR